MPYRQIRLNGLALTRGRNIDSSARSGGYPAYPATWSDNKTSVLSILYEDGTGIYLTADKTFKLVTINGGAYFSANVGLPAYIPEGTQAIPWYDSWANQSNTSIDYNGLVLQAGSAAEALSVLSAYSAPIAFYRDIPNNQGRGIPWEDQGAWIGGVNRYGQSWGEPVAYSWWPTSALHYGTFWLSARGNQWALRPTQTGTPNINSSAKQDRQSDYLGEWEAYGAYRWMFTNNDNNIMKIDFTHIGGSIYQLTSDNKRLNQAGQWYQVLPFVDVWNGVEFFEDNNNGVFNISIVVVANTDLKFIPDDTLVYRVGPYAEFRRLQTETWDFYNPMNVTANLPKGGNLCSVNVWDGTQLDCYQQPLPYTFTLGNAECTTVDSFSNDVHCQEWGKTNKGEAIETRLRTLCSEADYTAGSVCNCFLSDNVYYNRIASELGANIARGVQATKGLQCESGLCPQDGSLSAQLYYYGGRRCDYCIQVFDLNLTAQQINANINLVQQCASTDASYTWNDLIGRLTDLGAYVEGVGGTYKDVIISRDKSTIYLNGTTTKGKYALQQLPLLQYIPTTDKYGRIVITEETWKGNITGYSRDIVLALLYIRAPSQ